MLERSMSYTTAIRRLVSSSSSFSLRVRHAGTLNGIANSGYGASHSLPPPPLHSSAAPLLPFSPCVIHFSSSPSSSFSSASIADVAGDRDAGETVDAAEGPNTASLTKIKSVLEKAGVPPAKDDSAFGDASCLFAIADDVLLARVVFLKGTGVKARLIRTHPSILALDLETVLGPALKRLGSLGVEETEFLVSLVAKHPETMEFLAGFPARVEAMKESGKLSEAEAGTVIVELSGNSKWFLAFLKTPEDQLVSSMQNARSLWGESNVLFDLLKRCPALCLLTQEDLSAKLKSLEAISKPPPTQIVSRYPPILLRNAQDLDETLSYWKSFDELKDQFLGRIARRPEILAYSKQAVESTVEYLETLDVPKIDALSAILRCPGLVGYGVKHLTSCIGVLQESGLDNQEIGSIFKAGDPAKVFLTRLHKLRRKLEFLEAQGIIGDERKRLIVSRPDVLALTGAKKMQRKSEFLEQTLDLKKSTPEHKGAIKAVLALKDSNLEKKIDYLVSLGFERSDILKMVKSLPGILSITRSALAKKTQFLVDTMKRPVKEIVSCPEFFFCSMKNTLLPRYRVLSWLEAKQSTKKPIAILKMVQMDEEAFLKEFVASHPEREAIYRGNTDNNSAQTEAV